ncbi:hypothetical protein [Candidatus Nitrospira bockiana]
MDEAISLGGRVLNDAVERGIAAIQDRLDIEAVTGPGRREGETSTRLRLKVFPKGKAQPNERVEAESLFNYSLDPEAPHFSFEFRLVPRQPARFSDDYL